jgi:hypothetical protein
VLLNVDTNVVLDTIGILEALRVMQMSSHVPFRVEQLRRLRHGMEVLMEVVSLLLVMRITLSLLERVVRIRKWFLVEDQLLRMLQQQLQQHIRKHGMVLLGLRRLLGLEELELVDGDVMVVTTGMEVLVHQ